MAPEPRPADAVPPVFGRPSPAAGRPGALRRAADGASAAYRADGGDGVGWSVRAASVAGVRHRLAGYGPEDAFAWRVVGGDAAEGAGGVEVGAGDARGAEAGDSGVGGGLAPPPRRPATVILAVADGVGSVAGSAAAASAAVDAACEVLASEVLASGPSDRVASPPLPAWSARMWPAAFAAADAAVARAGGATTLVLAVVDGDRGAHLARLGDSSALVLHEGSWHDVWPVDRPDDAPLSTATAALPATPGTAAAVETADVVLGPGAVLVVVTDGIANPLRDGPTTVAPAFARALVEPPTPLALAVLADFSRQGCFDDRTVVGLWTADEPLPVARTDAG